VAAGNAAEGGDAERTPERSAKTFGEFRGDALYFNVAADGTVRGEQVAKGVARERKRLEQRDNAMEYNQGRWRDSQESSSARAAALRGTTCWANHQSEKPPG